jgi:hypothetical protein
MQATVLTASNCEPAGAPASPPPPHAASTPPLARHTIMFLIVFLSIKFSTLSPVQVAERPLRFNKSYPVLSFFCSCKNSMVLKK